MSPFVRGRAIAQVESSGRTKKSFDVLLWTEELLYKGFKQLDAIQQLREYLSTIFPQPVSINLWLPELDAEIAAKGLDEQLRFFPAGALRDAFRDNIRYTLRLSKYKLVLEDVVVVDGKNVKGLINPLIDSEYNFSKFHAFLDKVPDRLSRACGRRLSNQSLLGPRSRHCYAIT